MGSCWSGVLKLQAEPSNTTTTAKTCPTFHLVMEESLGFAPKSSYVLICVCAHQLTHTQNRPTDGSDYDDHTKEPAHTSTSSLDRFRLGSHDPLICPFFANDPRHLFAERFDAYRLSHGTPNIIAGALQEFPWIFRTHPLGRVSIPLRIRCRHCRGYREEPIYVRLNEDLQNLASCAPKDLLRSAVIAGGAIESINDSHVSSGVSGRITQRLVIQHTT
jgi:hypothetical protein